MNNLNNTKDKLALAHSRDSLLVECSFNQIDCNPSDFAWSFHRYRGNCFVFNDGKKDNHVKNSFLSGFIYGLKIKFYTGHYEKLDSFLSYLDILGVNVKIENNSFSVDSNNGFEVKSGTRTHVAIERIFKYNLPKPFGL